MILSDEQKLSILKEWDSNILLDLIEDVEAAVLSAVEARQVAELNESVTTTLKQEPVAWVYYPKGVGEKYVTYTNPASLDIGKQADRISYIEPLYTHPQPTDEVAKDAERYRWAKQNLRIGKYRIDCTSNCYCEFDDFEEAAIDAAMKGGE